MFIQTKSPKITGVITFTIVYSLGVLIYALVSKNHTLLPILTTQIVVVAFVCIAHNRVQYPLSLLWNLCLLGALNLAGNAIPLTGSAEAEVSPRSLNELWIGCRWLSFGTLLHIYGMAVITWMNWQTLCNIIHNRYQRRLMPSGGLLLLVVTSAMGYGLIGEALAMQGEFFFSTNYTIDYDLLLVSGIASTIGAFLAASVIKLRNL